MQFEKMGACWSAIKGIANFFCGCCTSQMNTSEGMTHINKDRSCTDKLLLLLFGAAWGACIYMVIYALQHDANIDKLTHGIDMSGMICGISSGVLLGIDGFPNTSYSQLPYAAFPYPSDFTYQVCMPSCQCTYPAPGAAGFNETLCGPYASQMSIFYPTTELANYCVPDFSNDVTESLINQTTSIFYNSFDSLENASARAVGDIFIAWPVIAASVGIAVGFSFLYVLIMHFTAGILIWACIAGIIAGSFLSAYFFITASDQANISSGRSETYKGFGYASAGFGALFILFIFAMRKRIQIAIDVVKEAGTALFDLKSMLVWPIVPIALTMAYFVWLIFAVLVFFSDSKAVNSGAYPPSQVTHYQSTTDYNQPNANYYRFDAAHQNVTTYTILPIAEYFSIFLFFHMLWNLEFLYYFGYIVIAGTVADWYFTPYVDGHKLKSSCCSNNAGYFPLLASLWRAVRYNLGTVAFASLLIAIIEFIRAVVTYIETKTKLLKPSMLQRAIFCMIQCCLACAECCLDKINKNAIIWCAIWGDSFIESCCESFKLLFKNLARVASIYVVSGIILFFGKLAISTATTGLCAVALTKMSRFSLSLTSAFVPLIIIFILTYMVAAIFMSIYASTIDTIFLCFLVDVEENGQNGRKMLAPMSLQHLVGKYEKDSVNDAKLKKQKGAGPDLDEQLRQSPQLTDPYSPNTPVEAINIKPPSK